MISYWITPVGPKSNKGPYKRQEKTYTEESDIKAEHRLEATSQGMPRLAGKEGKEGFSHQRSC